MQNIYEPESGILTVKYQPDNENVSENPPRFSWLPANEKNGIYTIDIAKDEAFTKDVITYKNINTNFFSPDVYLQNGQWFWRYSISSTEKPLYSKVRQFTINDNAVKSAVPLKENRFKSSDETHPRLWLNKSKVLKFKANLKTDAAFCNFDKFYENSVKEFIDKPFIEEPKPYPNNKRVIALWRKSYQDCQKAYNYIRFLSVAGVLLDDKKIINQAISATLELANWNINGATGRDYNDESAFRVAGALAWGYDWLYNFMTEEQRESVFKTLFARTQDVAHHALVASKIHYSLFDSHAVRSLSSVLMPCCIALLHHTPKAHEWLNYTIDYLNVLYTPWGGTDGGWSEGGLYWTTGMAYLIEALNLLKNYTDIDIFKRPFFRQTGSFPLYCFAHDTYRTSFCDQSNLGEKPILKTGFNAREFAGITGNGEYQWYFEQIAKREDYKDTRFFNTGWWDFYFDEMVFLYNYKPVKAVPPKNGRNVKWFKDIGWVAIHSNMQNEDEHIACLTKSSPYGSVSHSHGDQNSIVLFAFGEPLLIESGYYIGFNSSMHKHWRKQTKSQNNILIGGKGQYSGMDKPVQLTSVGKVVSVDENPQFVHVIEDATAAYLPNVPQLKKYEREIYFIDDAYFVIVDNVELTEKMPVDFLLHTLNKPDFSVDKFKVEGEKAKLTCEFVYSSSGVNATNISNEFDGVDKAELEGLDNQWHFSLSTNSAHNHVLVTCLVPHKIDKYNAVETIKDDQGHDVYLYFTHNGNTFSLCVDGDKRY